MVLSHGTSLVARAGCICLMATACTSEPRPEASTAIPKDSIRLERLHLSAFAVNDTTEGGYLIAAHASHVSFTPMRFPGVITVNIISGAVDTVGGVSGEGPGEFRSPGAMWYTGDTLFVYDRARAKLVAYLRGEEYVREEGVFSAPQTVASDTGRRLAFASSGVTFGGIEHLGGGGIVSFPPRTEAQRGAGSIDRVAVLEPGRYAVYDATAGAVVLMGPDGKQIGQPKRIPEWLHDRLTRQMIERSTGTDRSDFVAFPEAKFFISDRRGNAYLFYYLDDPAAGVAVRYSLGTDRWTRVATPSDSISRYMVANAFAGVIVGDTLHTTRNNGLASFRIIP
jgi:hypothetical protein